MSHVAVDCGCSDVRRVCDTYVGVHVCLFCVSTNTHRYNKGKQSPGASAAGGTDADGGDSSSSSDSDSEDGSGRYKLPSVVESYDVEEVGRWVGNCRSVDTCAVSYTHLTLPTNREG